MPYTHQMLTPGAGANDNNPILNAELLAAAVAFAEGSKVQRTRDACALHWREFAAWCQTRQVCALPCEPQILAVYITHLAELGRKPAGSDLAEARQRHVAAQTYRRAGPRLDLAGLRKIVPPL